MEQETKIRVVMIDDHSVVREGVRMVLENDDVIEVVGEAGNMEDALLVIRETRPDIVLLDLALGNSTSIGSIKRIVEQQPAARILVLTGVQDEELHKQALVKGAHGLLKKDNAGAILRTAIKQVHAGGAWLDQSLTESVQNAAALADEGKLEARKRIDTLTRRERDIVLLIASGHSNNSIGEQLEISEKTVRNRLIGIFDKLGVTSRLELAIFASVNDLRP